MLTPEQFGLVAAYVKTAIDLHPIPSPENRISNLAPDNFAEAWEKRLKDLVDNELTLPSYSEVECDPCIDFLVSYYRN